MERRRRSPRSAPVALAAGAVLLVATAARAGIWQSGGPEGGIVTALSAAPSATTTIYAGTSSGGVFRSVDAGASWAASAAIPDVAGVVVSGLAVDPSVPDRVFVSANAGPTGLVLRSTDGGASWTSLVVGAYASGIVVDPANPATLYASGAPNVLKSTDGGATWSGTYAGNTYCVAIDPVATATVYVCQGSSIAKTTDGGAHWTGVGNFGGDSVNTITVDPTNHSTLYAGTQNSGVFKSTNAGATWTALGPSVGSFGLDVTRIVVDPTNAAIVYVSGYAADGAGVYKSVDGGAHWAKTPLTESSQALAMSSSSTLVAGSLRSGIARTTDAAVTWNVSSTGLANTSILSLAVDAAHPGTVYAGSAAEDLVYRSTDAGASWTATTRVGSAASVSALAVDPVTAGTVYAGAGAEGTVNGNGVWKTTNDGGTWAPLVAGPHPANALALLLDPTSSTTVYAGGYLVGVYRSTNGGTSWAVENAGLQPVVVSMAIDPSAPATLYAGTTTQLSFLGVYKTTNAGTTWSAINAGFPPLTATTVQALAVDPTSPQTVYAGLSGTGGVYKTTNGGTSWSSASSGLGAVNVSALAVDAVVPGTLYAGTRGSGVFASSDGGASWSAMNAGLANLDVRALVAEPGRLYAATPGSGTFVTTVPTAPPQPVLGGSLRVTNPGDPSRRKVVLSAKQQNVAAPLDRDAFVSGGATLSVQLEGELPISQTFVLPAPWGLSGTSAVKYVDPKGLHGPVKSVVLKQSSTGTLSLSVQIVGGTGSAPQPHVVLVPPNPGTSARAVLSSGTGTWCIGFGGANGGIVKNTPTLFSIAKATSASCS